MTDTVTLPSDRNNTPARRGQATEIESSRAVAEVKAMVVVAQQCPRDVQTAIDAMRESCAQYTLAQRAFFRYSRGGSAIQGPSVHLARELARVWGNLTYGISELRRDDDEGVSEMQAYAWDIQTNTRTASIFMVPHMRDTKNGTKKLTDMRDIYESNANAGARRVREAIFAVLPPWFIEEAKDLCTATLADGGGKPLAQRVADAVKWYETVGVRLGQLEEKVGRKRGEWEGVDLARLEVISRSLRNGETRVQEEFEAPRVTAEELTKPRANAAPVAEPDPPAQVVNLTTGEVRDTPQTGGAAGPAVAGTRVEASSPPAAASSDLIDPKGRQMKALHAAMTKAGYGDRDKGLSYLTALLDREIASSKELTVAEASVVLDDLSGVRTDPTEPPGEPTT